MGEQVENLGPTPNVEAPFELRPCCLDLLSGGVEGTGFGHAGGVDVGGEDPVVGPLALGVLSLEGVDLALNLSEKPLLWVSGKVRLVKLGLDIPAPSPPLGIARVGCLALEETVAPTVGAWPEACGAQAQDAQGQSVDEVLECVSVQLGQVVALAHDGAVECKYLWTFQVQVLAVHHTS